MNPEPGTKIQFAENRTYEGYSTIIIDNLEKEIRQEPSNKSLVVSVT